MNEDAKVLTDTAFAVTESGEVATTSAADAEAQSERLVPTAAASKSAAAARHIFRAVRENNCQLALKLLESAPASWTSRDAEGHSLLHWGSLIGEASLVAQALVRNCPADARCKNQQTPLMWAIIRGHVPIVRQLLEAGAGLRSADSFGATPLTIAVQHPSDKRYQLMLLIMQKGGEDVHSDVDCKGCAASHWAAYKGDLTSLKLLVEFKSDLQALDNEGMLPLHRAIYAHQPSVIRFLLDNRSNPSQCINDGRNCFDMAQGDNLIYSVLQGKSGQTESADALETLFMNAGVSWLIPYYRDPSTLFAFADCHQPVHSSQAEFVISERIPLRANSEDDLTNEQSIEQEGASSAKIEGTLVQNI